MTEHDEDQNIVIRAVRETKVYTNPDGEIVIAQLSAETPEQFVHFPPEYVESIIAALRQVAEEVGS